MTELPASAPTRTGTALRRFGQRLALFQQDDFRRDTWRMGLRGLRQLLGFKLAIALAVVFLTGGWFFLREITAGIEAYTFFLHLFALVTLLAAAPIYAAEQRQGTLELLWLARGSRKALIRYKTSVLLLGLSLLIVPSILLASWFLGGQLPILLTLIYLLSTSFFIISVLAWTNTILPQVWAGGLLGTALIVALYLLLGNTPSHFNMFLNPIAAPQGSIAGGGAFQVHVSKTSNLVINRLVTIGLAIFLLRSAQQRLAKAFQG